jgi:hypothetical protein
MNERLERILVVTAITGPIALAIGFVEWAGIRPGAFNFPFTSPVALSQMWWHVPIVWLRLTIAFGGLWWLGERLK